MARKLKQMLTNHLALIHDMDPILRRHLLKMGLLPVGCLILGLIWGGVYAICGILIALYVGYLVYDEFKNAKDREIILGQLIELKREVVGTQATILDADGYLKHVMIPSGINKSSLKEGEMVRFVVYQYQKDGDGEPEYRLIQFQAIAENTKRKGVSRWIKTHL